jgi:hypothetical protein
MGTTHRRSGVLRLSSTSVSIIEEAYRAFAENRDLSPFYDMLSPDVEWRAWNDEGNCHNRDEVMDVIRAALDRGVAVELPGLVDAGDKRS